MEKTKEETGKDRSSDGTVGVPTEGAGREKKEQEKKKSNLKTIIIAVAVVALVVIGVVGYGLYNGSRIANYAKDTKAIMVESNSKWSQANIDQGNRTTDEMYAMVKVIKTDSDSQLKKLNGMKAPEKAKNLEAKSKEYFQLAGEAGTNMLTLLDYVKILEASGNDLKSFGGTTDTVDEFVTLFTGLHNKFTISLTKLRAANPPASYKDFNDKYIAVLDKMDKSIVKAIGYVKSNQNDMMVSVMQEFESATKDMDVMTPPNEAQAMDEILSEAKRTKLKDYPGQVKDEADNLAKTVFSF